MSGCFGDLKSIFCKPLHRNVVYREPQAPQVATHRAKEESTPSAMQPRASSTRVTRQTFEAKRLKRRTSLSEASMLKVLRYGEMLRMIVIRQSLRESRRGWESTIRRWNTICGNRSLLLQEQYREAEYQSRGPHWEKRQCDVTGHCNSDALER
jgi:hypothetical protein